MTSHWNWLAAASALTLMAGCGSRGDNAQTPVANESANAEREASNPFADAEAKMSEEMMAAVGSDAGDSWARKMIAHHQGAVEMSQILLRQNPSPDVAEMARSGIAKQQKDISDIRKLLKDGPPNPESAEIYRPAMMDMQQKMQAATGADASELFMRKMLEHHRGAVAMSDVALRNGVSGVLREQVEKTRSENQKDAEMVEAMLRGETMQHAMADSGAKSAEEAKAEPAPADKAPAKPKSAAKPTQVQPKPAEPKPPASECLPEHRAAGHC